MALLGASLAVGAWGLGAVDVTTDVTHFLPELDTRDRELAAVSSLLTSSELTRTWVLTVEGPDADAAVAATAALEDRLQGHPEIDEMRSGPDAGARDAVRDLYLPRAPYFWRPPGATEPLDDAELSDRANRLAHELSLPTGALVRAVAPEDPLSAFTAVLERLERARGQALEVHDGRFVTDDGRHGVLLLRTRARAFRTDAGAALGRAIDEAFAEVVGEERIAGPLVLEQSSLHRFAVDSERRIREDVTRISVVGAAGVLVLFFVLFRSLRAVALMLVPLVVGTSLGVAAAALFFGTIHGITLAFGASLVGVAVDYVIHGLAHHALGDGRRSLRGVWTGVLLGGFTTVAGLAGLAWASFPGLRELAVVGSVGVLGALGATRLVLPIALPEHPHRTRAAEQLADVLQKIAAQGARRRRGLVVVWLAVLAIGAVGLPQLQWADSLRALNRLDPDLAAEDQRVRDRVSRMDASRFVVAIGDSMEDALRQNDAAWRALSDAEAAGEIGGVRSLADFTTSARHQIENLEALRAPGVDRRFEATFAAHGFVPGAFEPFLRRVQTPPRPLTYDDLAASPLAPAVRPFVLELDGDRIAILSFLRGVQDPEALRARLAGATTAAYFDQEELLTSTYGAYRARTLTMVVIGLGAVLLLLILRHRRVDLALAASVPAALAALTTLGVLGLLGMTANLMHLVALLLILSMGVDYGVFIVEHRDDPQATRATLVGLVAACLTTVLSFGLLAASDNPALSSLGLSLAIGVILAVGLAPAAGILVAKR